MYVLKDESIVVRVVLRKEVLRVAAVRAIALAEHNNAVIRYLVLYDAWHVHYQ